MVAACCANGFFYYICNDTLQCKMVARGDLKCIVQGICVELAS